MVVALLLAGCGAEGPSMSDARAQFEERFARSWDPSPTRKLKVVSFDKSDGVARQGDGANAYDLHAVATVEHLSDSRPGDFAESFLHQRFADAGRDWHRGDRFTVRVTIAFEKRESGWVATKLDCAEWRRITK